MSAGRQLAFGMIQQQTLPPYIEKRTPSPKVPNQTLEFVDLFSGIGGFHLGMEHAAHQAGHTIKLRFASDINEAACATYRKNFHEQPRGDVVGIPAVDSSGADLLFGGFPCQPFSNSGLKRGLDDERGGLFFEIKRLILGSRSRRAKGHIGPRAFILENVAGIATNGGLSGRVSELHVGRARNIGNTMVRLEHELSAMRDYDVAWAEVVSSDFGSPQVRRRVFILGVHRDLGVRAAKLFPSGSEHRNSIRAILEGEAQPSTELNAGQRRNILKDMKRTGSPSFRDGLRRVGRAYHCEGGNVGQCYHVDGLAPTLTAVWSHFLPLYLPAPGESVPDVTEVEFKPNGSYGRGTLRRATVRETLRLQGFPDDFEMVGKRNDNYQQIGNAVNVNVVNALLESVISALGGRHWSSRGNPTQRSRSRR
jgi:DNA (cytosine-5)-methyltransferase 1